MEGKPKSFPSWIWLLEVPLNEEVPLPNLVESMADHLATWGMDAHLQSCLEYAQLSKYVAIPIAFKPVFGNMRVI